MAQDQHGQAEGTGYAGRVEVVPDDGTNESQAERATPMTHFQKVAASPDAPAGHDDADATRSTEIGPAGSRDAGDPGYQDDPDGKQADDLAEPELRPGAADSALGGFGDLAYGSLLPDALAYRQRWQQVQFRFVDDPHGSVAEAADVIAQVTARLEAAVQERQRAIAERQRSLRARWSEGARADTETLRATLLTYRAFLDQLTGAR